MRAVDDITDPELPPGPGLAREPVLTGWYDPPLPTDIAGIVGRLRTLYARRPRVDPVALRLGTAGQPGLTAAERERLLTEGEIELLLGRLIYQLADRALVVDRLAADVDALKTTLRPLTTSQPTGRMA